MEFTYKGCGCGGAKKVKTAAAPKVNTKTTANTAKTSSVRTKTKKRK